MVNRGRALGTSLVSGVRQALSAWEAGGSEVSSSLWEAPVEVENGSLCLGDAVDEVGARLARLERLFPDVAERVELSPHMKRAQEGFKKLWIP